MRVEAEDLFVFDLSLPFPIGAPGADPFHVGDIERLSLFIERQPRRIPAGRTAAQQAAVAGNELDDRDRVIGAVGDIQLFAVATDGKGVWTAAEEEFLRRAG